MRKVSFYLFFIFSLCLGAQSPMNNALRLRLEDRQGTPALLELLVRGNIQALSAELPSATYRFHYNAGGVARISCDADMLQNLLDRKLIGSAELIPARKQPLNDTMLKRNRVLAAKLGEAPLQQGYDGSGIILGFVDTGIDFNHPDFKDSLGNTRISFLWDQAQPTGSASPQPYNYGCEWTASQINASLCTHSDAPYNGHGTHVAGIAAGNGRASNSHYGIAPKAEIIAVAINFNKTGPTIADGVRYIFDKATAAGKPCVVNISLGDYYGSHDGTDLEAQLIDNLLIGSQGRAVVAAAGNAGNLQIHARTQPQSGDTLFTWLRKGSTIDYWCYGDTQQVKNLRFSIGANRQSFSDLGRTGFNGWNDALNTVKTDTLYNNGNRIGIVRRAASVNSAGVYELYVNVSADTSNLFWRVETTGQGLHHAWNFDFVSSGLPSQAQYPKMNRHIMADSLYTLVSSFQCSDEVITVANYNSTRYYYDSNNSVQDVKLLPGQRVRYSSVGPTRDSRQKPDVSAAGHNVLSAFVLSMIPSWLVNNPELIAKGKMHVLGGGTSAASPVVAGIAALYFQKNPGNDHRQLKKALIDCSFRDAFTGNGLPDYVWGHGKVDGKNTLLCGENLAGLHEQTTNVQNIFPNPFSEGIHLPVHGLAELSLYAADGRLLHRETIAADKKFLGAEPFGAYKGLLLLRISEGGRTEQYKLIKD